MPSIYTRNKETGEWEKVNSGFNYTPAETDPTLSLEGSPADAKATGDAINSLRQEVENINIPDVDGKIGEHNVDENAHADIRNAIPTALSGLTDDANHRTVTDTEKVTWNAKSNFSGNYNDLTNKPIFIATYGTTTYAEIKAAYDAGKICFCKNEEGTNILPLFTCNSTAAIFANNNGFDLHYYRIIKFSTKWTAWSREALTTAGGTLTDALVLAGDPTKDLHAATKQYVDNAIANAWASVANAEEASF